MEIYEKGYAKDAGILTPALKVLFSFLAVTFFSVIIINTALPNPERQAIDYANMELIPEIGITQRERDELEAKKRMHIIDNYYPEDRNNEPRPEEPQNPPQIPEGEFLQ